jgi:hypothetical protein
LFPKLHRAARPKRSLRAMPARYYFNSRTTPD